MNPREATDGEIVAAVLGGTQHRFQELVDRYQRALFQVARSRLGTNEAAEDVVQETFLCAYRFLPSYDSQYSFRTWLWTILLNQCNRDYRRQSRRLDRPGGTEQWAQDAEPADATHSPESRLLEKERAEILDAHLQALPPLRADALRLRFFGGLKFQEIAEAMGCSISTAKNRVRWGLEEVSNRMAGSDETQSPSAGEC